MKQFLDHHDLILIEAAVVERLRRDDTLELDPRLVHAPLLYEQWEGKNSKRFFRVMLILLSKQIYRFCSARPLSVPIMSG